MKSALELAMERADAAIGDEKIQLTPEQIKAIDDIRKVYEAKWAEQEISLNGRMAKLARETDPQTFAEHRSQLEGEINRVRQQLFSERDEKIEAIRKSAQA
jgi:hypothetical protein